MIEPTHRENDQGMITAELLKLLGVTAGLGLGPLLSNRLGWYWAIGMAVGGTMLLAGAALSLSIDRRIRRARAEQMRDRLLQETALVNLSVQVHSEPKASQEMLFSNPRLASLRANLEAGWISERQFSTQAGQILNEVTLAQTGEDENFSLPNSVIALGVFILLPAIITVMVITNRIDSAAEIAAYFSSPALLLWMAVETLRLVEIYREQPWKPHQLLAWLSSLLHVLAGLAMWIYLGLFFGELLVIWVFIVGASLAGLGALLRLAGIILQRRAERQAVSPERISLHAKPVSKLDLTPTNGGERLPAVPDSEEETQPEEEAPAVPQPSRARFEVFKGKDGKYYFHLRAGNGEIILASQGYASLRGCQKGIRSVQANAGLPERYQVRTNRSGEPYFVLLAGNRQVIGRSESYSSEAACARGIRAVGTAASTAVIREMAAMDESLAQGSKSAK